MAKEKCLGYTKGASSEGKLSIKTSYSLKPVGAPSIVSFMRTKWHLN